MICLDVPAGQRPPAAHNLTLTQEAGGWVLRWLGPKEQDPEDPNRILYYTVESKSDSQGGIWKTLNNHQIDVAEASYMSK